MQRTNSSLVKYFHERHDHVALLIIVTMFCVCFKSQSMQESVIGWNIVWRNLHHQHHSNKTRIFISLWHIQLNFHWNALKTNISRSIKSVINLICSHFIEKNSEQIQQCRGQLMVLSSREIILEWNNIVRFSCFYLNVFCLFVCLFTFFCFVMCFLAWFLQ